MALNLSSIKVPSGVNLTSSDKAFAEQGGTIGRGDANDWVLPDPDRFLSSKHCLIAFEAGQFYITDMSTNGTFINGSSEPIGKGGKMPLNEGDVIELGDYQFRVSVGAGAAASTGFSDDDPFAANNGSLDDPFATPGAGLDDPFGSPAPLDDPFAPAPSGGAFPDQAGSGFVAPSGDLDDPFAGAGLSDNGFDSSLDKPSTSTDDFLSDPFSTGSSDVLSDLALGGASKEEVDPLAALDGMAGGNSGAGADPFASSAENLPPITDVSDLFGDSGNKAPPPAPTQGDDGLALNQSIDWPEAKMEHGIPEDWDDDFLSSPAAETPAPLTENDVMPKPALAGQGVSRPVPSSADQSNRREVNRSIPLTDPPRVPPADAQADLLNERQAEKVDPFMEGRSAMTGRAPAQASRQPAAAPQRPSEPSTTHHGAQQTHAKDISLEAALLEGMGLLNQPLTSEQKEYIYSTVGELVPVIITGMMQVLRSRASIKNEFRMNVTTIQPIENNPLKFSANAEDAIDSLFVRKSAAYKQPIDAFQEGFDGIGEHQVAIIAGIRAAFKSLMDRFNPETLEKQFDRSIKSSVLPGKKAKYWNSYQEYYNSFAGDMESSFQFLFGDEFVQAYEEQLRKLAAERRK